MKSEELNNMNMKRLRK